MNILDKCGVAYYQASGNLARGLQDAWQQQTLAQAEEAALRGYTVLRAEFGPGMAP
jgi:hypothetical protein